MLSCNTSRLRPCCRLTPGYGGFERTRNLTVTQKSPKDVAMYKNDKYIVLVDKSEALNKLGKHIVQDSLQTFKLNEKTTDTLDLTAIKIDSFSSVKKNYCQRN